MDVKKAYPKDDLSTSTSTSLPTPFPNSIPIGMTTTPTPSSTSTAMANPVPGYSSMTASPSGYLGETSYEPEYDRFSTSRKCID